MKSRCFWFALAAVLVTAPWSVAMPIAVQSAERTEKSPPPEGNLPTDIRVMSFNIRYGTADDGPNRWEERRERLAATIRDFDPDLLGTQETLGFQRDWLAEKLPDHEVVGVGREDGAELGEMTAVCFRRSRFRMLESGHFWLSETPDRPGSRSWDAALPRMVTWVRLAGRDRPGERPVLFLNTHFDHQGEASRLESARLLRSRIGELGGGCSVVVSGDFNAGEDSPPYRVLFGMSGGHPSPLVDCFRAANPQRTEEEGTFSGFRSGNTTGSRIDWIGASPEWKVVNCRIDRSGEDGRTPSDHFPVTAVLRREAENDDGRLFGDDVQVETHPGLPTRDGPEADRNRQPLNPDAPKG